MKSISRLAAVGVLLLAAPAAFGQTLFSNFNGVNPFTHGFGQTDAGLALTWSSSNGIQDSQLEAGCVVSSGVSGKVKAAHLGAPGFSLNNGMSYTISEYVQANSIGVSGDYVMEVGFGVPTVLQSDSNGIAAILENLDGTNLGIVVLYQDPVKNYLPAVQLTAQPALGDWVKVTMSLQETDVATGAYGYTLKAEDFGPTGVTAPVTLLSATSGTFTDGLLGGHATANWIPAWKTTVPGNAFDNLAAEPTPGIGALVVAKGDMIESSILASAGPAAIDSAGDVAIHAYISNPHHSAANNNGILLYSGTTITVVAAAGDPGNPAPGTSGAVFTKLSDPALSGSGALAFYGTLQPGTGDAKVTNDAGIWVSGTDGVPSLAVRTSGTAPEGSNNFAVPVTFSSFTQLMVNNAGGLDFLAGIHGTGVNTTALFATDTSGTLQLLTAKGIHGTGPHSNISRSFFPFMTLPTVAGQSRTFDTVNGSGALLGQLDPPALSSIGLASSGTGGFAEQIIVETSGTVPNLPGVSVKSMGEPIINANQSVAFTASLAGTGINAANNFGIGVVSNAFKGILLRIGDPAADATGAATSGTFTKLGAAVLNNNDGIAFVGTEKEKVGAVLKSYSGIWSSAQGTLTRLVRASDPAPGGGTFLSFDQIVLPGVGDVIFGATLTGVPAGENKGVFQVMADGSIVLIQRTGVLLPVHALMKQVASLQIFVAPPYVTGQSRSFDAATGNIVYQATFTDATWAIYEVTR